MKVIVTGASGFVGGHLIDHLLEKGDQILAVGQEEQSLTHLQERGCECVALDIRDAGACAEMINSYKPDVVFHLAGIAFVPQAENDFNEALLVNVGGTHNIVQPCHLLQRNIAVVYASSAEVYGKISSTDLPINETVTSNPANNYSLTKLMSEQVLRRYGQYGHIRPIIMRPFNHIGAGQNQRFVVPNFSQQLAKIVKSEAPAQLMVGNLEARRDFSDVRDIVRAYRLAAEKGVGTYNLCSGKSVSIQEVLNQLIVIAGVDVEVTQDPKRMRASEVPEVFGSFDKAKKELGWEPSYSLADSLKEAFDHILKFGEG